MAEYSVMESPQGSAILRRDGDRNVVITAGLNPSEASDMLDKLNHGPTLRVGDALEWVAAGAFIAAAYMQFISIPLALAVFGIFLCYQAQCLAATEVRWLRLP